MLYKQAIVILDSSSERPAGEFAMNSPYAEHSAFGIFDFESSVIGTTSQSLNTYYSSIPVIEQWELSKEYRELGEALSEMTALEGEDEWKIDAAVYNAASYVAAELMAWSLPAPRIFSHGPKSVVFNWLDETSNLYLTISADKMSALISTPERITRRIDAVSHTHHILCLIPPSRIKSPVLLLNRATSDLPDFIG